MAMRSSWLRLLNGSFDTKNNFHLTMEHSLHQPTPCLHPDNKIIVCVALPCCGTTSFISFMKALFPDETKVKFIHQYNKFSAFNLAEFLTHPLCSMEFTNVVAAQNSCNSLLTSFQILLHASGDRNQSPLKRGLASSATRT
jgi:hypothetical protein